MMTIRTYAALGVLVYALSAPAQPASAANQEPSSPAGGGVAAGTAAGGLKVVILKPSIRFDDIAMVARKDWGMTVSAVGRRKAASAGEDEYEHALIDAAKYEVGARTERVDIGAVEPSVVEACKNLEALSSRLARGNVSDDATNEFARLAAFDERYAVLAQFVRVQTGPGGSWDPNTGAISSSTASTLIQAALLSAKTGKVIWKGERLIRGKVLRPSDAAFGKALKDVYKDFDVK